MSEVTAVDKFIPLKVVQKSRELTQAILEKIDKALKEWGADG